MVEEDEEEGEEEVSDNDDDDDDDDDDEEDDDDDDGPLRFESPMSSTGSSAPSRWSSSPSTLTSFDSSARGKVPAMLGISSAEASGRHRVSCEMGGGGGGRGRLG
jgi:hypothetical protein